MGTLSSCGKGIGGSRGDEKRTRNTVIQWSADLLRVFAAGLEGTVRVGGTEGAAGPDLTADCRLLGSSVTLREKARQKERERERGSKEGGS